MGKRLLRFKVGRDAYGRKVKSVSSSKSSSIPLEKIVKTFDDDGETRCAKILLKTLYVDDAVIALRTETETI